MELKLDHTFAYQDGVPIRWSTFGNGPPLVFIHGTPWSSQLCYPIARCLASSFAVYLFDLPGYGYSQPISGSDYQPTYPAQTKAFCALLQHWRSTREEKSFVPHVVAHDIGGHIALRAVLMEYLVIKSLTLVDCGASYPVDEQFFSLVWETSCVFMSLPPALHQAMLREYVRGASYCGLRKDQEDMLVQPWLSDEGQKGFYAQIEAQ
jgi:pimeloyl-ACP methyl ester carboxylesterase